MLQSEKLEHEIEELKKNVTKGSEPGNDSEPTVDQKSDATEGQGDAAKKEQPGNEPVTKQKKKDEKSPSSDAANNNSGTNWEHRFKSFKVSADNTIHNLRTELAQLKVQYSDLINRHNSLRSKIQEYEQAEQSAKTREKLLDPEITKVIGDDVANVIADTVDKRVRDAVDPIQSRLNDQNRKEQERAAAELEQAKKQAQDAFVSGLREIVSRNGFDFDQINQDPDFINSYLKEADPITGVLNETVLGYAIQNNDYLSAAKLFVAYGKSVQSTLNDDMLEPLGSGSGTNPNQVENQEREDPNSIKESEINAFYDGGWKDMTIAEQEAFKKRVDRCAAMNTIRIGE